MLAASIIKTMSGIALMMEVASTSETSVNFYQNTRRKSAEDSNLYKGSRSKVIRKECQCQQKGQF
jgi:hypothetical protein